jgi:hypothetical protein
MHPFTVVSALAGMSLVLAKPRAAPAAAPLITAAPLAEMVKPALERRQMESEECSSKAQAIWDDQPKLAWTSGDPLVSWLSSLSGAYTALIQDVNIICSIQNPATIDAPDSISLAYASFLSMSASWASKVEPAVTSLAQSCGGGLSAGLELVLATDFESCTSLYGAYVVLAESIAAQATGLASTDTVSPTATAGNTSSRPTDAASNNEKTDAGASSSESTAGAPRETGYVFAAAAAVVAVAGAVVAL